ncbi:gamma-butyrobetaine hydroxylase-like domain-containing protein [Pseudoduganella namucuonensis]|uniref:DUF971 family protein n=1 Tax=Pseudoduganella namucuonensis TaxID=1035707 RepID=A0A1I7INZ8_9BURK|nr:gamma-butyrobetaine hydroxylase-like domain-containing protein [Pseudoduganella namucuonensis]SFU74649.1 DUF971 family protein [Pseudoduganella namucuonensis]
MSCEPWPSALAINHASRTLELVWDGAPAALAHAALRASCRCAHCESARRAGGPALPMAPDLALARIEVLGASGLQLFFSDGHHRGIYPWPYLYQLAYERPMS